MALGTFKPVEATSRHEDEDCVTSTDVWNMRNSPSCAAALHSAPAYNVPEFVREKGQTHLGQSWNPYA